MINTEKYKTILLDRLEELDARLHHIEDKLDEPHARDSEDMATEREEDEMLESLGNAGLLEVKQIKNALKRIANGTYGECVKCGNKISTKRLDLIPHTALCRNCA